MRGNSLILSAVLHTGVIIIAMFGLPFLAQREFLIPPPLMIEFVELAKVTETNKPAPQPALPKPEETKPAPAAQNSSASPVVPVPQEKPKLEEKKEVKAAPVPDPNAPPDKTVKKIKPDEEAKKEPTRDFSSVLKNLVAPKDALPAKDALSKESAPPAPGQNAPLGAKLTMSEEDALRSQLEKCWNVPFGARDAENMVVDIFMVINPDRTLREARIVDQGRYHSDSFFRAAADSALRAVRSPLCSPFALPPDKYDTWSRITVTFNPKDMF